MEMLEKIALGLIIVGAINWGLVGVANFNLVNLLFGMVSWLEKTVYIVVGLCGLYSIKMFME